VLRHSDLTLQVYVCIGLHMLNFLSSPLGRCSESKQEEHQFQNVHKVYFQQMQYYNWGVLVLTLATSLWSFVNTWVVSCTFVVAVFFHNATTAFENIAGFWTVGRPFPPENRNLVKDQVEDCAWLQVKDNHIEHGEASEFMSIFTGDYLMPLQALAVTIMYFHTSYIDMTFKARQDASCKDLMVIGYTVSALIEFVRIVQRFWSLKREDMTFTLLSFPGITYTRSDDCMFFTGRHLWLTMSAVIVFGYTTTSTFTVIWLWVVYLIPLIVRHVLLLWIWPRNFCHENRLIFSLYGVYKPSTSQDVSVISCDAQGYTKPPTVTIPTSVEQFQTAAIAARSFSPRMKPLTALKSVYFDEVK
jgi:hypothetical protein